MVKLMNLRGNKKRYILLGSVLICAFLLIGCSSSTVSDDVEYMTEESDMTETGYYNDEIVECQYNSELLYASKVTNDYFDYLFVVNEVTVEDPYSVIDTGNCIYVLVIPMVVETFDSYPRACTMAIFDEIFDTDVSDLPEISEEDGIYRYDFENDEQIYSGRVYLADENCLAISVMLLNTDSDDETLKSFQDVWGDFSFSPEVIIEKQYSDKKENDTETTDELVNDEVDDLNQTEETVAAQYNKIADGELYDAISEIYSDVALTASDDHITISIYLEHSNNFDDSVAFFDIAREICLSCCLEDSYSNVSFMMYVDDSLIAMLTLVDYVSNDTFSASYLVFKDEYEEVYNECYENSFGANDITTLFENDLQDLADKYGIDY